jgi:Protein of unknown function (DUF2585)
MHHVRNGVILHASCIPPNLGQFVMPSNLEQKNSSPSVRLLRWFVVSFGMTATLVWLGRRWWCECGRWDPTSWDIWSSHNSQHLVDPYFFSHVLHGVLFFWFLRWTVGGWSDSRRLFLAFVIEAIWEIFENSPFIIDRYREATISLDYVGDSIANSWFDVIACLLGYIYASKLKWQWSVALFVAIEVTLLLTIRDCLILNVLMLVYPIEAIKNLQSPG